ncbi:hypothetical protein [Desulfosporosinus fructosivorans]
MQLKSEPHQLVTVEGNGLWELFERAKYLGRELKEIILFITFSMLLIIGISLLPESPVPVQEQQLQQQYIYNISSSSVWSHYIN